ncbi:MAG: hypothetical protein ACE5KH_05730 [Candidatus Geothermarchaeales archaeon]
MGHSAALKPSGITIYFMSAEIREALHDKIDEEQWISRRELLKFGHKRLEAAPSEVKELLMTMKDDGDIDYVVSSAYRGHLKLLYRVTEDSEEG